MKCVMNWAPKTTLISIMYTVLQLDTPETFSEAAELIHVKEKERTHRKFSFEKFTK